MVYVFDLSSDGYKGYTLVSNLIGKDEHRVVSIGILDTDDEIELLEYINTVVKDNTVIVYMDDSQASVYTETLKFIRSIKDLNVISYVSEHI